MGQNGKPRENWKGQHSTSTKRTQAVARTQDEWENIWQVMTGNQMSALQAPRLPKDKMVVAIFMGDQSSGGYSTDIKAVREEADKIVVDYTDTAPSAGVITTCVITSPFEVRWISKSDKNVTFEDKSPKPEVSNDLNDFTGRRISRRPKGPGNQ